MDTCISEKNDIKNGISIVILWGAIWGITEATLGYVLHLIPFKIGAYLWFPLAFYFMEKVYRSTHDPNCILYTSIIASAIKLVNLFMETRLDRVINPAVSIILEGMAVFAAYKIYLHKGRRLNYPVILAVNFAWKILYILYLPLMPKYFLEISPMRGLESFAKFFLLESVINSIIIFVYIKATGMESKRKENKAVPNIILSCCMLLLAVVIQWFA